MNGLLLFFSGSACMLSAAFAVVMIRWRKRFAQMMRTTDRLPLADLPMVSLLVPARNDAATIGELLRDLEAQDHPAGLSEVIVINDHSEDGTQGILEGTMRRWPLLRVLSGQMEGKKAAITQGVGAASGGLIILTDADARCGPNRVRCIAEHWLSSKPDMILLPVCTTGGDSFLSHVQEDEQAALLVVAAVTASLGTAILANGANLAFTKNAFTDVGGYRGDRFASGDDVFLLERMRRSGKTINYLLDPEALVFVRAEGRLSDFWQQRIRWAGKMRGVAGRNNWISGAALLLPWLLLGVSGFYLAGQYAGKGQVLSGLCLLSAWLLWLLPAIGIVRTAQLFFARPISARRAFLSCMAFSTYAPMIAIASLFVRPIWKGRRI